MTEEQQKIDTAWTSWSRHKAQPTGWREIVAQRLSEFDWAMLLVPGIIAVSAALIVWPLMALGVL